MDFRSKYFAASESNSSLICVGLDSELSRLPECLAGVRDTQLEFNKALIDATADLVCAYKTNSAFYECLGPAGVETLIKTIEYIPDKIPVILDAKRGDIGNSSRMYAKAAFEVLGADAITVSGYMGRDSVLPFCKYADRGVFVLVKTSNPSAYEIQDLCGPDGKKLYALMAQRTAEWNRDFPAEVGCVAGATHPADLELVREIVEDGLILVPGAGAQGGDLRDAVKRGINSKKSGLIINSSRGIIFASSGSDFAEKARHATLTLRDEINGYIQND